MIKDFKQELIINNDSVYSRYILKLFESEFPNIQSLKDIIKGNNQVVVKSPIQSEWDDQEFVTNGANIEEVLVHFLEQNSEIFEKFQIEEVQQLDGINYQKQDFKLRCLNKETRQKCVLDAKFFIFDCHNDNKQLIQMVHRCQVLKVLQPILPMKIHEEIYETIQTKNKDVRINRYCVLYFQDNEKINKQISLKNLVEKTWKQNNKMEAFSLEKCGYFLLQMIDILNFMNQLNLFCYLDLNSSTIFSNQELKISLKADFENSFKLYQFPNPSSMKSEPIYLYLNLYHITEEAFKFKKVVRDKSIADSNQRYQIATMTQQMLNIYNPILSDQSLSTQTSNRSNSNEKSKQFNRKTPQQQLYQQLEDLIGELKHPQKVQSQQSIFDLQKDLFELMYTTGGFLRLMNQLLEEKKYDSVIHLYKILIEKQFIQSDLNFNNKHYILQAVGRSFLSIYEDIQAIEMFIDTLHYTKEQVGEVSIEYVSVLYWLAKSYCKSGDVELALDYCNKALVLLQKIDSEKEKQLLQLIYYQLHRCYLLMDDFEKAMTFLERQMVILNSSNLDLDVNADIGKCNHKIGLLLRRLNQNKQCVQYFEKSYQIYERCFGEKHLKTLKVLKDFGLSLIQISNYQQALKTFILLLTLHQSVHPSFHIEIFNDYKQLGICQYELKNYKDSMFYLEKAMNISNKIFILDNYKSFVSSQNILQGQGGSDQELEQYSFINYQLGLVHYKGLNNSIQGEKYFTEAYKKMLKVTDKNHQFEFIAELDFNIALCEYDNKKYDQSIKSFQQSMTYYIKQDPKDKYYYEKVIQIYEWLIKINEMKNLEEVVNEIGEKLLHYILQTIPLFIKDIPTKTDREIDYAKNCLKIAKQYKSLIEQDPKHVERALTLENEALKIYEQHFKNNKQLVIELCMDLGNSYLKLKQQDLAVKYMLKAKQYHDKMTDPREEEQKFKILYNLANICFDINKRQESMIYFRQLLTLKRSSEFIQGFFMLEGLTFRMRLGSLLFEDKKYKESISHLDKAYMTLKDRDQIENREQLLEKVILNLSQCYFEIREYELSLKYYEELLQIQNKIYEQFSIKALETSFEILKILTKISLGGRQFNLKRVQVRNQIIEIIYNICLKFKEKDLVLCQEIEQGKEQDFTSFRKLLINKDNLDMITSTFQFDDKQIVKDMKLDFLLEEQKEKDLRLTILIQNCRNILGIKEEIKQVEVKVDDIKIEIQADDKGTDKQTKKKAKKKKKPIQQFSKEDTKKQVQISQ